MIEFIQFEFEFFILCLTTLFTLINPIGIAPILIVMTERFSKTERINIAWIGSITAFLTLVVVSIVGSVIFNIFGITIEAFQIMGGIIFFRNGLRMLEAKVGRSRTTPAEQEESQESNEIAISPIGKESNLMAGNISNSNIFSQPCWLFSKQQLSTLFLRRLNHL